MSDFKEILGKKYVKGRRVNNALLWILAARDIICEPFLSVNGSFTFTTPQVVCVSKLDHLGDVLMAIPALRNLRARWPTTSLILIVGEWCEQIAKLLQEAAEIDGYLICSPASLNRSERNWFRKIAISIATHTQTLAELRRMRAEIFVDMRARSPNSWILARFGRNKYCLGFGVRGMAFVFHDLIPFSPDVPIGQLLLNGAASLTDIKENYHAPGLPALKTSEPLPEGLVSGAYFVVQMTSVDSGKNIRWSDWSIILDLLPQHMTVVFVGIIGNASDIPDKAWEERPWLNLCGKTTLEMLFTIIKNCAAIIGIDSLVAHAGLACEKSVGVVVIPGVSEKMAFPVGNRNLTFLERGENWAEQAHAFCRQFLIRQIDGCKDKQSV